MVLPVFFEGIHARRETTQSMENDLEVVDPMSAPSSLVARPGR